MSEINTVIITACACAIICSLLTQFVSDGGTKRILSLVMGAFIVCSMIVPIKNAVQSISFDLSDHPSAESIGATADEVCRREIIKSAARNLEKTLKELLLQNGITIKNCEIVLAETAENSIIISGISIYIDRTDQEQLDRINQITRENFGITPDITAEQP